MVVYIWLVREYGMEGILALSKMREGFYVLKEYGMEVMSKFREDFRFFFARMEVDVSQERSLGQ